MKKTIILALCATVACAATHAQPAFRMAADMTPESTESYRQIKTGDVTMTINPQRGGRIMSLKYKDKEVISQLKAPESFGSTFWTSPQKEWNWPPVKEFDKMPYTVEERDGRLVMTSQVSEKLKFRIRKDIGTDVKDGAIVVTYTVMNESGETRQVAPWEITRVLNGDGVIFFDAPADNITAAGQMDAVPFSEAFGAAWYKTDEAAGNRKINADGKGWLAYCSDGMLLVKTFDDLNASQPAPGEAEIQIYVNRGKTFIELESQGAYTTLKPGEELNWTVRWYLLPVSGEAKPSAELLKRVKDCLKK